MSLTPLPTRLRPADLLSIFQVPGYRNVYHLPTAEAPQRIVSQQRRSLNLVYSLRSWLAEEPRTRTPVRDLAVIGGGFGGMTAAAYAASFGFTVTLYEKETELLSRFRNSTRWIFPHLHDWPTPSWRYDKASLPVLTWSQGEAQAVRETVMAAFQWCMDVYGDGLRCEPSTAAKPIPHASDDDARIVSVLAASTAPADRPPTIESYRAVILATGFSEERIPEGHTREDWPSYWDTEQIIAPEDGPLVISGMGDGGLADLIRACGIVDEQLPGKLSEISDQLGPRVLRELQEFEEEIAARRSITPHADLSRVITRRYCAALRKVWITGPTALPSPTYLVGSGRHQHPFREGTYPGNRALAIALLNAHRMAGREWKFLPGPVDLTRPLPGGPEPRYPRLTFATFPRARGAPDPDPARCRAVLRNGPGAAPIEKVVERTSAQHLKDRTVVFDLALTERPLFPGPLRHRIPAPDVPFRLPGLPRTRRLRVYSEFYDSYIQRNLAVELGAERTRDTLLGRLRLQCLLFDEVVLTDAMVLDGEGLAEIALTRPEAVRGLLPYLHVTARGRTLERSLLAFLGARGPHRPTLDEVPELSLAADDARREMREELHAAFETAAAWPVRSLAGLRALVAPLGERWEPVVRRWEAVCDVFSAAPRSRWGRILGPTPLTIPPRDTQTDVTSVVSEIARRFRDPRTVVFGSITRGAADALLRDDEGTARVVEWYNSAYNEALAIRQKATVFESFWIPNEVVEDDSPPIGMEQTTPFSYCAIGLCRTDDWHQLAGSLRTRVLRWRSGQLSLGTLIQRINRGIGFAGADSAGGNESFTGRLQAYGGQLILQEAAFTLQGGRGLRDVRCIMDCHERDNAPLAATRLFGGAG